MSEKIIFNNFFLSARGKLSPYCMPSSLLRLSIFESSAPEPEKLKISFISPRKRVTAAPRTCVNTAAVGQALPDTKIVGWEKRSGSHRKDFALDEWWEPPPRLKNIFNNPCSGYSHPTFLNFIYPKSFAFCFANSSSVNNPCSFNLASLSN